MSYQIAIIGTGLIGRAWAISFARAGNIVKIFDPNKDAISSSLKVIKNALKDLEKNDFLYSQTIDDVLNRITIEDTLENALKGTEYVQESSPEDLKIKKSVFKQLDEIAESKTILASSSSAFVPSTFSKDLTGRNRCLVAHPINPPYLIPAVELCPAPWTDQNVMNKTHKIMKEAGHTPILMTKELDGFIMNRLQGALLQEAFRLVDNGYASVEDIDRGISEGLSLRWSFMGPFETIDLNAPNGVRDYIERYGDIYARMGPDFAKPINMAGPVIDDVEDQRRKIINKQQLKERQAWRDRRLMALAVHKKQSDKQFGK